MNDFLRRKGKLVQGLLLMIIFVGCGPREFDRPNIILIMADDLGYGDITCYGNENIKTPSLDKLAAGGMKFTDYHSNGAVCSPTRAALMTGRYQQRSGLEGVIYAKGETRQTGLAIEEETMADFLKRAGYATGMVGKWHLGYHIEYNPIYQGFDFFRGYVSGNVDYQSHVDGAGIPDWWHNLEKTEEKGYTTELITDYALKFIQAHKDEPFFLYVAQEAPHYPFQGPKDKADRFPGVRFPPQGSRADKQEAYKEMIESMDTGIGKIVRLIEDFDLQKHTLIFFCSDNGGFAPVADNGSLKGYKGSLWEGGHRVPAIAYWPGYIQPNQTTRELTMSMDLMPTFINLSKFTEPPKSKLDGIDITRLLIENRSLPDRAVFWRYRDQKAVRHGDWKLIVDNDTTKLYQLDDDLLEQHNVSVSESAIVDELKEELQTWEEEVSKGVKMKTK